MGISQKTMNELIQEVENVKIEDTKDIDTEKRLHLLLDSLNFLFIKDLAGYNEVIIALIKSVEQIIKVTPCLTIHSHL